ncbi:hypothetical protein AVEN_168744-1 [Araneus ventricosus]|uniref:Uncharacterized protein n=1 Tax=Araneus ventricosus TaxID=182803 RepID=A0A4Y2DPN8_ARAVE|nr:hypothetical protein AVEN_168744-1 [Araneus ventricosus]
MIICVDSGRVWNSILSFYFYSSHSAIKVKYDPTRRENALYEKRKSPMCVCTCVGGGMWVGASGLRVEQALFLRQGEVVIAATGSAFWAINK